jgi:hypothetical protein
MNVMQQTKYIGKIIYRFRLVRFNFATLLQHVTHFQHHPLSKHNRPLSKEALPFRKPPAFLIQPSVL